MLEASQRVQRRHVFFFSGFDPKGASYYQRLYREQAALQGAVTGVAYTVGGRQKTPQGNTRWEVVAQVQVQAQAQQPASQTGQGGEEGSEAGRGGETVHTTYEYLRWDDIVRSQWPRGAAGVFKESVRTYRSAVWPALRAWPAAPNTVRSLFYPVVYWLLAVLLALGLGLGLATLVRQFWGAPVLAAVVGLAAAAALFSGAWQLEKRLHTSWLLRIFSFAHAWAIDAVPGLDERLNAAAQQIKAQLDDPAVDEVLLVGFSVGSMWAVSAAARTVGQPAGRAEQPNKLSEKLSVLTLGHCIPLLGLMPEADKFRRELQQLGAQPAVCWADVSAPGDWGSFALVDPVPLCRPQGSSATVGTAAVNPRCVVSPRFHTLFEPAAYQLIKKDKRRMHMQYLMAAQLPGVYDYFALTAGPLGLRERLARGQLS